MTSQQWGILAMLASLCIAVYAATAPQIGIDCGSLAGKGRVAVIVDGHTYVWPFECGKEA
jgi:hypothetical protein